MKYSFPMVLPIILSRSIRKLNKLHDWLRTKFLLWLWGIESGRNVFFSGPTIIRTRKRGSIKMGSCILFNSRSRDNLVGLLSPTILDVTHGGEIVIGSRSGFSSVVMSSRKKIYIGDRVMFGGNVRIFDHDFHSIDSTCRGTPADYANVRSSPIIIEDDVFVGTNSIILKGTSIGARSIVAAGSVVFGLKIPPDSMVKGNPACVVGKKKR